MAEVKVTEDAPFIRVIIIGEKSEPMRQNTRQGQATRAAKKFKGCKVSYLSGGGAFTGEKWELNFTYVPADYQFPRSED